MTRTLSRSQTIGWFGHKQLDNEIGGSVAHIAPIRGVEFDLSVHDFAIKTGQVIRKKWRETTKKNVGHNANGPDINSKTIWLFFIFLVSFQSRVSKRNKNNNRKTMANEKII